MVLYICSTCKKQFNQKGKYTEHINRKTPCQPIDIINNTSHSKYYCEICDMHFCREDSLKRHVQSKRHVHRKNLTITRLTNCNNKTNPTANNKINTNCDNNNSNTIDMVGNHNMLNNVKQKNITNNNVYIVGFGGSELDLLTDEDMINIFLSKKNLIQKLIEKTNLNPSAKQYHNVGCTDLKSGNGHVYTGNKWTTKRLSTIMETLLNSKRDDLHEILGKIEYIINNDNNVKFKSKMADVDNKIQPKISEDVRAKKNLVNHIKTDFYNGRELVKTAMLETGAEDHDNCSDTNRDYSTVLKDGITIEDVRSNNKNRIKEKLDLQAKKEYTLYILDIVFNSIRRLSYLESNTNNIDLSFDSDDIDSDFDIDTDSDFDIDNTDNMNLLTGSQNDNYQSLKDTICETGNIDKINVIIKLLCKLYHCGGNISDNDITNALLKEMEINCFIKKYL